MKKVRTAEPSREQTRINWEVPEEAIPEDHPARMLWRVVEQLDLSAFTREAKALEGKAGRRVLSVRMLLTLWLYAISVGVGSAREIARRIHTDVAFRWIVGDKSVGHATLSSFRASQRRALDQLLTDVLGVLLHRELISLEHVAQDGTRVRASAGGGSFRRERSLAECREQAALHLRAVLAEAAENEGTARERQARVAAAKEYQRRVDAAITVVQELQSNGKDSPRASTTDAEARVMKMGDGGFRPAYNIQLATSGSPFGGPRTIVGVRVTNIGSDRGSLTPMLEDIERRTGRRPKNLLADGDHFNGQCIATVTDRGVTPIVAMVEKMRGRPAPKDDPPQVAAWRTNMHTTAAKQAYRVRASLAELTNAHLKTRFGISRLLVRGIEKVTSVTLLAALAANILAHAPALVG